MDTKDYCHSLETELNAWKAKMYNMVRKVNKLQSTEQDKITSSVKALHSQIEDMERIIDQLRTECPIDFSPQKKEVDETSEEMRTRYDDAMGAILRFQSSNRYEIQTDYIVIEVVGCFRRRSTTSSTFLSIQPTPAGQRDNVSPIRSILLNKSRHIAAKKVGICHVTATKAGKVVKLADEHEAVFYIQKLLKTAPAGRDRDGPTTEKHEYAGILYTEKGNPRRSASQTGAYPSSLAVL